MAAGGICVGTWVGEIRAIHRVAPYSGCRGTRMSHQQEIELRTEELTDTMQVIAGAFPNLKADHRPSGADWYRWLIYNDATSAVIGVVELDRSAPDSLSLMDTKRLLRSRAMDVLRHAA